MAYTAQQATDAIAALDLDNLTSSQIENELKSIISQLSVEQKAEYGVSSNAKTVLYSGYDVRSLKNNPTVRAGKRGQATLMKLSHNSFTCKEKVACPLFSEYKELPVQHMDQDSFKFYISSSSSVLLRPFKLEDTFYIATFFNTEGRDNWNGFGYRSKDLNDNNMVSISKYDANNEQHDICYMMRVFTSPTFKKTKKDN